MYIYYNQVSYIYDVGGSLIQGYKLELKLNLFYFN